MSVLTTKGKARGRIPKHRQVALQWGCIAHAIETSEFTYEELAHASNVSRATLHRMNGEPGQPWICDLETAKDVAAALDIPVDNLLLLTRQQQEERRRQKLATWGVPLRQPATDELARWLIEAHELDGPHARDEALSKAPEISGDVATLRSELLAWRQRHRATGGRPVSPDEDELDAWRGELLQPLNRLRNRGIYLLAGRWCRHVRGHADGVSQLKVLSLAVDTREADNDFRIDRSREPLEEPIERQLQEDTADEEHPTCADYWDWERESLVANQEIKA